MKHDDQYTYLKKIKTINPKLPEYCTSYAYPNRSHISGHRPPGACLSSKSPPLAATGRPANLPATSLGLKGGRKGKL